MDLRESSELLQIVGGPKGPKFEWESGTRPRSPHPAELKIGPFCVDVTPLVRGWLEDHRFEARLVAAASGGAIVQHIIVDEQMPRPIDKKGKKDSTRMAVVVRQVRWLRRTPLEQLEQRGVARRPAFARALGGVEAKRRQGCCWASWLQRQCW